MPPTKTILLTRPNYDFATACLHYFSDKLVDEISAVGEYKLIDLDGSKVKRQEFEAAMCKLSPRLVILNGHGSELAIYGQKGEIILDEANINLLNSKVIYAVACESSEKLGDIAVDKGKAEAYIGYEAEFMIVVDPSRSSTPNKDANLKVFIKPYMALVLSLISGSSVNEAIKKTKDELRSLIRRYGVQSIRDEYGDAPLIRFALFWDLLFLRGYGNLSATI